IGKDQLMSTGEQVIGKPVDRVEGRLKVTGRARYTGEVPVTGVTYGVLVLSTIARGRITDFDVSVAEKVPGIIAIHTHRNTPKLAFREEARGSVDPSAGRPLQPLQDEIVHYHGQPIAVVVADTLEHATQAAALVRVAYREERAVTDFATAA